MNIEDIEERIRKCMDGEDIKKPEFRYAITSTEFGDIGKYITHDQKINPNARPHGSKNDEILAYGQTLVQLSGLMQTRGITLKEAYDLGLKNWEDADWRKRKAKSLEEVTGIIACNGYACGESYVVNNENPLKNVKKGSILIVTHAKPDIAKYLDDVSAVVTDHGGATCHLANIARERNVPCIVGTGNATDYIQHGKLIVVDARSSPGKVYLKKS